jgi:sterol desaturase/sphingolipid hydroxylase (fatty acid hydroxylase superfamily)
MPDAFFDFVIPVAKSWTESTIADLIRYAAFAFGTWFVVWVVLAKALQNRKIRPDTPPTTQMIMELLCSLRSVAIFSTVGLITYFLSKSGLLPGPDMAQTWGPAWFMVSLVLMLIGHDAWFYWTHRLVHRPTLFRSLHRRHHRSHNPTPFTAYSFDVGEAALHALFVTVWLAIVPTPWEAVGLFVVVQIARNTIGHCGYELFPANQSGKPLFDWMTTVTHHDLHHEQAGWNYGLYFTFWDRVMGTEHPDYHARFARSIRHQRTHASPVPAE